MSHRGKQPQATAKAAPRQIYRTQLQNLENQWQEYNRMRTELNMQIQQAAKVVAAESRVLRSRLVNAGFTEDEINTQLDLLDASDHNPVENPGLTEPSGISLHEPQVVETAALGHPLPLANLNDHQVPHSLNSTTLLQESKPATADKTESISVRHPQYNDTRKTNGISCTRAAEILLDMSANSNRDEVEAELGCTSESDCEIDNLRLFEIMNR